MSLYSIVFQDVTLFDNTILENIRLGRKGATDEEVLAAAKLANLRGICREAAGQVEHQHRREWLRSFRRRASAHFHRRSFLKDEPIILLDEATASLDVENETAIQEALSRLIKNKNRPHHRPPDAHRSRCGSGGGAVGRHRGRAGQSGRTVRPQGTIRPHGGSAVGKPELDDLFKLRVFRVGPSGS